MSQTAFPDDLDANMSTHKMPKSRRGLSSVVLRDLVVRSDGGLSIIGEKAFTVSKGSNGPVFIHFHEILVFNTNPNGSLAWYNLIPKRQVDDSDAMSSYQMIVNRNHLHFMFNDHVENIHANPSGAHHLVDFQADRPHYTRLVSIDGAGNMRGEALRDGKDTSLSLIPSLSAQTNRHEAFIYARGRDHLQFGRLTFL
ncbi:MAG: hypothetical protein AAF206_24260 [Bacteroidota bacterium]